MIRLRCAIAVMSIAVVIVITILTTIRVRADNASNIAAALNALAPGSNWVLVGEVCTDVNGNPGLTWLDSSSRPTCAVISAYVPVPVSVTRRQYYMEGAAMGWFTQAQALALIQTGTLPPSIVSYVNSLPANQQFAAQMYLIGETTYYRNNALLNAMATAGGISQATMDAVFIAAALL